MGVPGFFKWLVTHCPAIQSPVEKVDCLYVDMNGILHPCCHSDAPSENTDSEGAMMEKFCMKMDEIIFNTRPRKLIYFAFDGPAPNAKMVQQRSRRFCARRNTRIYYKMYNRLAKEWKQHDMNIPPMPEVWDSNQITPGTFFMTMVRKTMEKFIVERAEASYWTEYRDVVWLLSDSSEPGEGEHKLIQFIKKQHMCSGYDTHLSHCLVGMDADLLQLALSIHDPNILIYRDETFIHIGIVREYFRHCFSPVFRNPRVDSKLKNFERLLDDLLLCFCFVGNDFLPPLPQLKITTNAIGRCIAVYISVLPTIGDYLTHSGYIHMENLSTFLRALSRASEGVQETLRDVIIWHDRIEKKHQQNVENREARNDEHYIFWSTLHRRVELYTWKKTAKLYAKNTVRVSTPGWQNRYYKKHWPDFIPDDLTKQDECIKRVRTMVNREYLRGLQWVQHYYHRDCPDWDWYYPYLYGPSLDAIHPEAMTKEDLIFPTPSCPLLPLQQLMVVIPREGAEKLLPLRLVHLMDTDLKTLFPKKFQTDCSNCPPRWMESAILPEIKLNKIRRKTEFALSLLDRVEHRRSRRLGVRMYVHRTHTIVDESLTTKAQADTFFSLRPGQHGLSGIIYGHKTRKETRKLSETVHRYQYILLQKSITPNYLERPGPAPIKRNLVHRGNSIAPFTSSRHLNWAGLKGFCFHLWGVDIKTRGRDIFTG